MDNKGKIVYNKWDKAIKDRDLFEISNLLTEYPKLINQGIIHYRGNGTTFQTLPLNMVNDSIGVTKLLIEKGADPNEYGDGNVLALHNANSEVTKYLISKGADVNRIGYEECTPIMYEVYMHNNENVKILIEKGADVNYQSQYDGYSSLHWAARKGDLDMIKLLIKNGANINSVNNEKQKPKDLAKENVHDSIFEYLEKLENKKLM